MNSIQTKVCSNAYRVIWLCLLLWLPTVQALGPVKVDPRIDRLLAKIKPGVAGPIVVDAISFAPDYTPEALVPEYRGNQIGRALTPDEDKAVLLKSVDTAGLVRQAAELGLREAGYEVLAPDSSGAGDAWIVDLEVVELWLTVQPVEGTALTHQFDFEFATRVTGNVPELAGIGVVTGSSTLESKKPNKPSWYRKTIQSAVMSYADNFRRSLNDSVLAAAKNTVPAAPAEPVAGVEANLRYLEALRDAGILTPAEFEEFSRRVLEQ